MKKEKGKGIHRSVRLLLVIALVLLVGIGGYVLWQNTVVEARYQLNALPAVVVETGDAYWTVTFPGVDAREYQVDIRKCKITGEMPMPKDSVRIVITEDSSWDLGILLAERVYGPST